MTIESHINVDRDFDVEIPETAHQISSDSWYQVAFVLTTGINSAYVLGYSGTIMVPLGWVAGVVGLVTAAAISLYANFLVANLHLLGGKRHIRYRDLAGHVYGHKMYSFTWALQYANLFMINIGYIILGGSALKAVYFICWEDHAMKLPYFIAIAGLFSSLFAMSVPHLSALRFWLGISTFFSFVYIVAAFVLSIHDGIEDPRRDYNIPGSKVEKIFTTVGAAANLVFAFNTGMLPEIQATLREPVIGNMLKALYLQFTAGVVPLFAVTFAGYWAYGSGTSPYLLNNVSGPAWVKASANASAFLQTVIALHIFASPMYEYLDTRFGGKGAGPTWSAEKMKFRLWVRGGYVGATTLAAASLPFLGDFMSLTGAVSTFPLTFILANHMYLRATPAGKMTPARTAWHLFNIFFFGLMSLTAAAAALRLISLHSSTYHLFADL